MAHIANKETGKVLETTENHAKFLVRMRPERFELVEPVNDNEDGPLPEEVKEEAEEVGTQEAEKEVKPEQKPRKTRTPRKGRTPKSDDAK